MIQAASTILISVREDKLPLIFSDYYTYRMIFCSYLTILRIFDLAIIEAQIFKICVFCFNFTRSFLSIVIEFTYYIKLRSM